MPTLNVRKQQDILAVVRAARQDAGLPQADLAKELGLSRDYIVDLEAGQPNLYAVRLLRVLHRLGIRLTLEYGQGDDVNRS